MPALPASYLGMANASETSKFSVQSGESNVQVASTGEGHVPSSLSSEHTVAAGGELDSIDEDAVSKPVVGLHISQDLLLEFTGQQDPDDIRDVVLRNLDIRSVEGFDDLDLDLQSISLAKNRIACLDWKVPKISLTELNVSHNQLVTLEGIEIMVSLQSLHANCNQIADIQPLRELKGLHTLALFQNRLDDLDGCVDVLAALPELNELELDGNPCSRALGYRRHLLASLNLKQFDGELVTSADHESYLNSQPFVGALSTRSSVDLGRPRTAPRPQTAPGNFQRSQQKDQIFRDSSLNGNPILLEYLAKDACQAVEELCPDAPEPRSFVRNLRGLATSMAHVSALSTNEIANVLTPTESGTGLDAIAENPQDLVRRLLKTIEKLQAELMQQRSASQAAAARQPPSAKAVLPELPERPSSSKLPVLPDVGERPSSSEKAQLEELRGRVQQLERENKNMWNLQTQNKLLKEALSQNCERLNDSVLVQDNTRLREQLKTLTEKYRELQQSSGSTGPPTEVDARPRTAEEIFRQFESYDEEVAQLLKRNTIMFEEIKTDLNATKRELSVGSETPSGTSTPSDGHRDSPQVADLQVCGASVSALEPGQIQKKLSPTAPLSRPASNNEKPSPKKKPPLKPSLAESLGKNK